MDAKADVTINDMQARVRKIYRDAFGRTPLKQRLDDILGEATELHRYTDIANLKEEAGDLLSSLLMLMNENSWLASDLLDENLAKIKRRMTQYKGLGRKLKVALLGGAFSPPHLGHIQVAKLVLDTCSVFDEVWLTPCNSHLFNKNMAPAKHRLEMCRIATQMDSRIKIFDFEISNKLRGESYHMVKKLLETDLGKNKCDFSFVIGLDNANCFDKWVNHEELERLIRFVVVPRVGETKKRGVTWYQKSPHIFIDPEKPIMDISSTQIREALLALWANPHAASIPAILERSLDPNVLKYIFENDLYHTK